MCHQQKSLGSSQDTSSTVFGGSSNGRTRTGWGRSCPKVQILLNPIDPNFLSRGKIRDWGHNEFIGPESVEVLGCIDNPEYVTVEGVVANEV
jgi:hypothetical protein